MGATASLTNLAAGTNHAPRRGRFNEAELVRERKDGVALDDGRCRPGRTTNRKCPSSTTPRWRARWMCSRAWRSSANPVPDFAVDDLARPTQLQGLHRVE